ncbi:MAG: VIT domain-containing protein, partial [Kiritimatiellia bacterium]|nr:VIT domain-containing protein [Kiritimatiellia bacterium]
MKKLVIVMLLVLAVSHSVCLGSGMLIPKDKSLPPLAIKYQRVDIRVKDSVATAKIEQVFKNSTNRDLEAVYVFPLPAGATIADFAMYINGKRMSGEVVEKGKARKIYQDIVRRMKDPGLLEHMGENLFRVSVYPVPKNGEQKFELEYSQELEYEAGLYKLVYPLRTSEKSSRLLEDFTVSARVTSSTPLKSIYSPSHEIGISRKGEHEAIIGFEEEQSVLDKDFVLYYGVSKKDFGLNLLTHATSDEDGYFMMMLAPSVAPPKGMVIKKDVTFVFDTSGSMSGKKIEQARSALAYCVEKLNDGDRFNIIRFSTDVEPFKKDMVTVDGKSREAALEFVKDIEARGGTAINDALQAAL